MAVKDPAYRSLCLEAAEAVEALPAGFSPEVMVGFDGFVDHIIDVVATRESSIRYQAMPTIAALGERISKAAGKSANLELVVKQSKIGGNGPIMANALCSLAVQVVAVGVLGEGGPDPVFAPLARRARRFISLGPPAITDALEFSDGKLMLGKLTPLGQVSYGSLLAATGGLDGLKELLRTPAGVATVNWTMTMEMTAIWRQLAAEVLPGLRADRPKWFIDLADPAKRTRSDIDAGLEALKGLQKHADVVLGLNEMECRQILAVCGQEWPRAEPEWEAARQACAILRKATGLSCVMCHLVRSSAVAWEGGSVGSDGFFEPQPKLTTGAGDHFNAGFFTALLAGVRPACCLQVGGATSGHYVRTGESPDRSQIVAFLRRASGG